MKGLEPPCLAAPDPKSGVSTNFTTSAKIQKRKKYKRKKPTATFPSSAFRAANVVAFIHFIKAAYKFVVCFSQF